MEEPYTHVKVKSKDEPKHILVGGQATAAWGRLRCCPCTVRPRLGSGSLHARWAARLVVKHEAVPYRLASAATPTQNPRGRVRTSP